MDLKKAKKLFFDYDGSRFYMSRNGNEELYLSFKVPRSVEKNWLAELTELKLSELSEADNCLVIHYLIHHGDYRHLSKTLAIKPLGKLSMKCAFLEELLKYALECRKVGPREVVVAAITKVIEEGKVLLRRARAKASVTRINEVIHGASEWSAKLKG